MKGINKVILIGTIGQNPDVKYMTSGNAVANFSLVTNENWKDKNTGEPKERAEWHRLVAFNKLGEIVGEIGEKGCKVYVEGALRTRKWQAQDGTDRYTTEVVVEEFQILHNPNRAPGAAPVNTNQNQGTNNSAAGAGSDNHPNNPQNQQQQPPAIDSFDDDIPF